MLEAFLGFFLTVLVNLMKPLNLSINAIPPSKNMTLALIFSSVKLEVGQSAASLLVIDKINRWAVKMQLEVTGASSSYTGVV